MTDSFTNYKKSFQKDVSCGNIRNLQRPLLGCKDWNERNAETSNKLLVGEDIENIGSKPLKDMLESSKKGYKGVLYRAFLYLFTTARKLLRHYPDVDDVKKSVLNNEKVHEAIEKTIKFKQMEAEENQNFDKEEMRTNLIKHASKVLSGMLADITVSCTRFSGWLFISLLRKLCSSVSFHQGQMQVLTNILEDNRPVLFLPLHYSHFDYILLSVVCFAQEVRAPFVVSGNNLNIPVFSYVMRGVGGMFIRRRIDDNGRDYIYRAVLQTYVIELLKRRQTLEVYIEGTRSRSGFPNLPKTGILSIVLQAIEEGELEDVTVVPINISYEKLIDGNFQGEMMGEAKEKETFLTAIRNCFNLIMGYYGHIRFNFGVPKSLKKILEELKTCPLIQLDELENEVKTEFEPATNEECKISESLPCGSVFSRSTSPPENIQSPQEYVFQVTSTLLAEHLVYRSLQTKVFMSTNVVGFLLIHRYRYGVDFEVLVDACETLVGELVDRKWEIGFSGKFSDVVHHALYLLGNDLVKMTKETDVDTTSQHASEKNVINRRFSNLVICSYDDDDQNDDVGDAETSNKINPLSRSQSVGALKNDSSTNRPYRTFVVPNLQVPYLFELAYYGNALVSVYAMESLAALTVGAVLKCRFSEIELEFTSTHDRNYNNLRSILSSQLPYAMSKDFSKSNLVQRTLELTDILRFDIVLCDVTEDLELCAIEAIDRLISGNYLVGSGKVSSGDRKRNLEYDDIDCSDQKEEDDQLLRVNLESVHDFISKQSVLGAMVEGYTVAAKELSRLLTGPMKERVFRNAILERAHQRINEKIAIRPESASSEITRHAIRSFERNKVIERCSEDGSWLKLTENYSSIEQIGEFLSWLTQYNM